MVDRAGAPEQSWYRGPLASQPLTRDPLGPYHSADQARRVVAETGAENISYASAFEVGRLLAAADARLAQELMRWRRGAFRASARDTSITLLRDAMRLTAIADPLDPSRCATRSTCWRRSPRGSWRRPTRWASTCVLGQPAAAPEVVAKAFGLESVARPRVLLGEDPALSAPVTVRAPDRVMTTLDDVLADEVGLAALAACAPRRSTRCGSRANGRLR